jgi:hypothetical protein
MENAQAGQSNPKQHTKVDTANSTSNSMIHALNLTKNIPEIVNLSIVNLSEVQNNPSRLTVFCALVLTTE